MERYKGLKDPSHSSDHSRHQPSRHEKRNKFPPLSRWRQRIFAPTTTPSIQKGLQVADQPAKCQRSCSADSASRFQLSNVGQSHCTRHHDCAHSTHSPFPAPRYHNKMFIYFIPPSLLYERVVSGWCRGYRRRSDINVVLALAESCSRCTKICLCRARRTLANDARVPNRQSRVLTASRRAHPQSRHRAHSSHSNYYTYFSNY